jgi:hypothetical protein
VEEGDEDYDGYDKVKKLPSQSSSSSSLSFSPSGKAFRDKEKERRFIARCVSLVFMDGVVFFVSVVLLPLFLLFFCFYFSARQQIRIHPQPGEGHLEGVGGAFARRG